MARPKIDARRKSNLKTRNEKNNARVKYKKYDDKDQKTLSRALRDAERSGSIRGAAAKHKIPKSTLAEKFKKMEKGGDVHVKRKFLYVLSPTEETAVVEYILWQSDRGLNCDNKLVKFTIREIHALAISKGEIRQPINVVSGPSAKYMQGFYKRHNEISYRSAERVDRGRINMASQENVDEYFFLLKDSLVKDEIMKLDDDGLPIQESIKKERLYLADEKGWGVVKTPKR